MPICSGKDYTSDMSEGVGKGSLNANSTPWNDGMKESWTSGYQKRRKCSFWLKSASLVDRFAEARGKEFLASSLKSAAGGRSSNLVQGYTCP